MALVKQPFGLPLSGPMNQKSDPKTLTGGISLATNAVYRKDKKIQKRSGWTSLSKTLAAGGSIASADAASTYGNEILLWSGNHLYTWSAAQSRWFDRGAAYSAAVSTKQIIASNQSYFYADSAYANGVVLVSYQDSNTRYQLYDYVTGAVLKGDTQLTAGVAIDPITLSISGLFFVLYVDIGAGAIKGCIINPATGLVTSTVTIVTDLSYGGYPSFDAIAVASDTIMLAYNNTSNALVIKYLNSSLGPRGGSYTDSSTAAVASIKINLIKLSSSRVLIAYTATSPANVQGRVVSATGSVGAALDSGMSKSGLVRITGHDSGTDAILYFHYQGSPRTNDSVQKVGFSTVTGGTSSALLVASLGIASRAWTNNGVGFFLAVHSSDLQATFFVIDQNGVAVSRHQPGSSGDVSVQRLSSVWSAVAGRYEFAIMNKTRLIATTDTLELYQYAGSATPNGSKLYSPSNVAMSSVDFQDNSNFTAGELGRSLLIVGGVVSMYDGISVVEQGFFLCPEILGTSLVAGGSVANGTYLLCACYEWADANGLIHRSAPSIPVSVTVSSGPQTIRAVVSNLRVTQKKSAVFSPGIPRADVTIGLYRTQNAQSGPFYRVSSITSPPTNSAVADSTTIDDTLADASLPGRDILYTAGGILDNTAPLPAKYLSIWRGRAMLTGGEGNVIQFSKPCEEGAPVEFAAENTINFESNGGAPTGLEILDEKLVLYKRESSYFTYGDGPDVTGQGGVFAPIERVANCDVGCIDQQSTCPIPGAVMFKSLKGYYMLTRDLQAQYIGAAVEDYNTLKVSSATLFAAQNEIRITNFDGVALVYNYFFERWSVFDNHLAVDGLLWNGSYVHVQSNGAVCVETDGTFRDDGANYAVSILTGWQAFGDVAGFQRIYRAQLVGEYKTPVSISLQAAYDFSDIWVDTGSIAVSGENYAWQFFMKKQKCEAMRFQLTATVSEFSTSGEGASFTSMTFLFGLKKPLSKLQGTQKTGLAPI